MKFVSKMSQILLAAFGESIVRKSIAENIYDDFVEKSLSLKSWIFYDIYWTNRTRVHFYGQSISEVDFVSACNSIFLINI